uniref:Uncharacterized protein n=1 Tax=Timema tahoe TaxID=61484 RepID=A0A7R9INQ8_9NEOP|nr:unnamed protein product [Timema tahoe]
MISGINTFVWVRIIYQLATSLLKRNNMKLFIVLLLAAPLVLAKPSHKSLRQGPDPEPGDELSLDGEGYLDAILGHIRFDNDDSPLDINIPGYEDSFESNERILELQVGGGKVRSIEGVRRGGEVDIGEGEDGASFFGSNLYISGAVLSYNYRVNMERETLEEGELLVHVDGVEAAFGVSILKRGREYDTHLGDVKTTAIGTIGDVEVSHNNLDDAVVTMIENSVQNHYDLDVAAAIAEGLTGFLDSAVKDIDVEDFPGDELSLDGEGYLDAILGHIRFDNDDSPLDINIPGYEDSFESNERILELQVGGGKVRSIEGVRRGGEVDIGEGEDGASFFGSNLYISGAVLSYNYRVNMERETLEEGELLVHVDGVEAAFGVSILKRGREYDTHLGDVKTTAIGTIGDVEVSHNNLDDAVVTMIENSVQNHYDLDVAAAIAEGLTGFLDSAVKDIDVEDFVRE